MTNIFYVYEHWRLDTDTCFYVGKGSGRRAYKRKRDNDHWTNIVSKLQRTGFGYEIRMVATGLTEEEAFALEIERIAYWQDIVDLANKTPGGEGWAPTPEIREKISKSKMGSVPYNKGMKMSDDFREKASIAAKNRKKPSQETRKKVSASLIGNSRAKGNKFTQEARDKLSTSLKGRTFSKEARVKLAAAAKRRWAEAKANGLSKI